MASPFLNCESLLNTCVRNFHAFSDKIIKPINQDNLLKHYVPLYGAFNYHVLALSVLNPKLIRNLNLSLGISWPMNNFYTVSSIAGFSLLLANNHHGLLSGFSKRLKYACSFYVSSLVVLGSILSWAIVAKTLPVENPMIRTFLALGVASGMLKIKYDILNHERHKK